MKKILFIAFALFTTVFAFAGKQSTEIFVFIEDANSGEVVAFQQVNQKGQVSFVNVNKGNYILGISVPVQSGRFTSNGYRKTIGYHIEKKVYFMNDESGFYTVEFSALKKVVNSNLVPVYELQMGEKNLLKRKIGKFEVKGNNAKISLKIEALTSKAFEKKIEKVKNDASFMMVGES